MNEKKGEYHVVSEIYRSSLSLDIIKGNPPEEAIRYALRSLFHSMEMAIRDYDGKHGNPEFTLHELCFPLTLTMETEQLSWDFRINMKLESPFMKDFEIPKRENHD